MAISKVAISGGHGKYVSGAVGVLNEVAEARRVVAALGALLNCPTFNDDASMTQADNLKAIVAWHNTQERDLDVSIHLNASAKTDAPMGTEVLYVTAKDLSSKVSAAIAKAGGFKDRGAKQRTDLAFLNGTKKPAILIEVCFVDSAADAAMYSKNFDAICKAIAESIGGITTSEPAPPVAAAQNAIAGRSVLTSDQLAAFLLSKNPAPKIGCTPLQLAVYFIAEGEALNVRGDVAFCQSLHETGWFKYGGQVLPEQNNYAGIGATNNSPTGKGAWFDTPQIGVRAQIQHLYAYATNKPLPDKVECADPRFALVQRGAATTWEGLNGKWAVPGTTYGQDILALFNQAAEFAKKNAPAPTKTPEEITVDNAIADGLITDRTHWWGVLTGTIKPVPEYIKILMDNAHKKLQK